MKNNKVTAVLLLLSILFQRILFSLSGYSEYAFPFASGLMVTESFQWNLLLLLYTFLPIPFMLFYFWGRGEELVNGYGKLVLMRSHSRFKLILREQVRTIWTLMLFVAVQLSVFTFDTREGWIELSVSRIVFVMTMYFLTLLCIIFLQMGLGLCFSSEHANLITNVYVLISLSLGTLLAETKSYSITGLLLFPNMAFASRNGVIPQDNISFSGGTGFGVMVFYLIVLLTLAQIFFQKKDIF